MFSLQVLFSNMFWLFFFSVGFISGTITLNHMAKDTFNWITKDKPIYRFRKPDPFDHFCTFMVLFYHFILWPLPLVSCLIYFMFKMVSIILSKSIWIIFKKGVIKIDKLIPKFKIV